MNSQLKEAIQYLLDATDPKNEFTGNWGYTYPDIERARNILKHLLEISE